MTLFDKLGIDEDAAITNEEIKAIQQTLEKIKIEAAGVAKSHDVDDTRAILDMHVKFFKALRGKSLAEIMGFYQQASKGGGSLALGSGTSLSPPAGGNDQELADLQDKLDKAESQNNTLLADRKILERLVLDLGLTAPADTNTPFPADTVKRVKDKVQEKVDTAATTAAVPPKGTVKKSDIKPHLDDAVVELNTLKGILGSKVQTQAVIDKLKPIRDLIER